MPGCNRAPCGPSNKDCSEHVRVQSMWPCTAKAYQDVGVVVAVDGLQSVGRLEGHKARQSHLRESIGTHHISGYMRSTINDGPVQQHCCIIVHRSLLLPCIRVSFLAVHGLQSAGRLKIIKPASATCGTAVAHFCSLTAVNIDCCTYGSVHLNAARPYSM